MRMIINFNLVFLKKKGLVVTMKKFKFLLVGALALVLTACGEESKPADVGASTDKIEMEQQVETGGR